MSLTMILLLVAAVLALLAAFGVSPRGVNLFALAFFFFVLTFLVE